MCPGPGCGGDVTLFGTTALTTSVATVVPTLKYIPGSGTISTAYHTSCLSSSAGHCAYATTSIDVYTIDLWFDTEVTTSTTVWYPVATTEVIPTQTVHSSCSSCGATTLYGATQVVTSVPTVIPTTSHHPPFGTVSVHTYTNCVKTASNGQCVSSTTNVATAIIDYFNGLDITTSVTGYVPKTTIASIPTQTIGTPCPSGNCGYTTLYGTTKEVTSVPTAVPTTSFHPPYGTVSTWVHSACQTYAANGNCIASHLTTDIYTIDYFNGRNFTYTVTGYVPVTTNVAIPTATNTLPCYKRDSDTLDLFEKRGSATSSRVVSKRGAALFGLLAMTALLL